jgi:hypothetical protein
MPTNTQAMHALLATANTHLATWVATGDANALQAGATAAQALVAHAGYHQLAAHDLALPYSPACAAWLRLSALVTLTIEHQLELPEPGAMALLPHLGRTVDDQPLAYDIAADVAQLADVPYLVAMRAHAAATPRRSA